MEEFVEKLIRRLEEERDDYKSTENYFEEDYGGRVALDLAIQIVNEVAEEYKPCHKSCTDCEEYDLARNHCPKFCKIIKETVKEIEEDRNGWISVDDRLPTEEGSYLVVGKTGGATVTRWYAPSKLNPSGHFGGNSAAYIRYWMPRPQAPDIE